jgi:hypothetical protein
MELNCHEMVELPEDGPIAVIEEYLPPVEREIEVVCANGHRRTYALAR